MRKSAIAAKKPKSQLSARPLTVTQLARALGVRHQLVSNHLTDVGAPPIADVEAWRAFLGETRRNGAVSPTMAAKIQAERVRILKATAEAKERENKIKSGEVVEFSEVRKVALAVTSFFFGELDRWRNTWPALFKGRGELEILSELDSELPKVKLGLSNRLKDFLTP